jgi:hypothetical protein
MKHWIACAIAALGVGCMAPPLPQTISVDPALPPGVHEAVANAADAWCAVADRTGWCPAIIADGGEMLVYAGHWATEIVPGGSEPGGNAKNNGERILLSRNLLESGVVSAEAWTGTLLHEFGHCGIRSPEHVSASPLMAAEFERVEDIPLAVDDAAVAAWCEQQGC